MNQNFQGNKMLRSVGVVTTITMFGTLIAMSAPVLMPLLAQRWIYSV